MTDRSFSLPVTDNADARLAGRWLKLGVLTLLAAAVHSVLSLLMRIPGADTRVPAAELFRAAQVVQLDLSVLIWPLAFAGVLWSLNATRVHALWDHSALLLASAGTAAIAVSPFLGAGDPIMTSYVPVLDGPLFYLAGWTTMAGFGLLVLRAMFASRSLGKPVSEPDVLRAGIYFSAFAAVVSGLALAWSYWGLPPTLPPGLYFELLFWGAGHVLALTRTLLLLVAWIWLCQAAAFRIRLTARGGVNLMAVALVPVLVTPFIYFGGEVTSAFHREAFTRLMQYGGLMALPLGAVTFLALLARGPAAPRQRSLRSALYGSLALFAFGGAAGFLAGDGSGLLAAHSLGAHAGVVLALMGLAYHLLPRLGFGEPMPRVARVQPFVYGGGQLLHVIGLVWSGGSVDLQGGTAGAAQGQGGLPGNPGPALTGLGELAALIGVLLFVAVAFRAVWLPGGGAERQGQ
ncbi:MAG: cbb3-type cytochrome c oxidase subunit I [Chromatiales bacterium]